MADSVHPRHRVVTSLSLARLKTEVDKLVREGWRPIGEPALASPADLMRPPYWAQAMYLNPVEIPQEMHRVDPPKDSKMTENPFGGVKRPH
jgi:hypothetical protein